MMSCGKGREESSGVKTGAASPPVAPQICSCPERKANRSPPRKLPRGPGPRWCHRVLGYHLNLETPRVKILKHLF